MIGGGKLMRLSPFFVSIGKFYDYSGKFYDTKPTEFEGVIRPFTTVIRKLRLCHYDTTFFICSKPCSTCFGRILAYICVVWMLVCPSIFDTTSMGIPDPRAMVVANV